MTGQDLVNLISEKGLLNERIETLVTPVICFCEDTIENKNNENIFGQELVPEPLYKSPNKGRRIRIVYKLGDIIFLKLQPYSEDYDDLE